MRTERPSEQQWPHRPYAELLMSDVLPHPLANKVVDTMQAYGATTMGVLANVGGGNNRAILGFIAYGFAEMLLRLDRIEEYLLFCYAHRYHDHSPGSWTAGEVAGLGPGKPIFCIPAQQTIPCVVRWMLAIEDHCISPRACRAPGWRRASRLASIRRRHGGVARASTSRIGRNPRVSSQQSNWPTLERQRNCM
jgi:hypothetical protein